MYSSRQPPLPGQSLAAVKVRPSICLLSAFVHSAFHCLAVREKRCFFCCIVHPVLALFRMF